MRLTKNRCMLLVYNTTIKNADIMRKELFGKKILIEFRGNVKSFVAYGEKTDLIYYQI